MLDAGTGLRELTPRLAGAPFHGSILVSHLHWDHVQGLPFFAAGDRKDAKVDLYVPAQNARTGRDLLAASMAPPNFPITPEGLEGEWTFTALDAGYHSIEDFRVRATEVEHKGGRTFGYRISDDTGSMAYIPDHVVSHGIDDAVRDLILDVDVLLHDAQFLDRERPTADNYGHSTVEDAVRLARECGVRHLVLFHHSPARKDDALDEIGQMYPPEFVTVATQGDGDRRTGDRRTLIAGRVDGARVSGRGRRCRRARRGLRRDRTRPCGRAGGTRAARPPSSTA